MKYRGTFEFSESSIITAPSGAATAASAFRRLKEHCRQALSNRLFGKSYAHSTPSHVAAIAEQAHARLPVDQRTAVSAATDSSPRMVIEMAIPSMLSRCCKCP